jgi:hypothetical protein
VLDVRPPFVKVFRRSGELRAAFLREGRGPMEASGPTVLAVAGDSLILIADSGGRLSTFDLDGRLVHHVPVLGIPILSATAACDGEWLLYGPRFTADGSSARWLHRLPAGAGPERVTSFLEGPARSRDAAFGLTYGLVATPGGAALRHDLGDVPSLVSWRCGSASPVVTPLDEAVEPPPSPTISNGVATTKLGAGSRMRSGLAVVNGAMVRAELVKGSTRDPDHTEFTLYRQGDAVTRSMPRYQSLLDSRPGVGVLIRTDRDDGHVVLIPESDLLALFGPAAPPR